MIDSLALDCWEIIAFITRHDKADNLLTPIHVKIAVKWASVSVVSVHVCDGFYQSVIMD